MCRPDTVSSELQFSGMFKYLVEEILVRFYFFFLYKREAVEVLLQLFEESGSEKEYKVVPL